MLIAICGRYLNVLGSSIRGNGKTLSAVFLAHNEYKKGRTIYTNFKTSFSIMYRMNDLITMFNDGKLNNVLVIIDEAQIYLNNSGISVKARKAMITNFIAQTRKSNVDVILTSQRFMQLHKELREQCDIILIASKYHYNTHGITGLCTVDNCRRKHCVRLFSMNSSSFLPYVLDCEKIGALYDSNEIILDNYVIEDTKNNKKPIKA